MPIHIFKDREGFSVWTSCDSEPPKSAFHLDDGHCIGVGETQEAAIADAVQELNADLFTLRNNPPAVIEEDK